MTSKERLAAAMAGRRPDRVPVMCQLSIGHMLSQTGAPPPRFWHGVDEFVDGLKKNAKIVVDRGQLEKYDPTADDAGGKAEGDAGAKPGLRSLDIPRGADGAVPPPVELPEGHPGNPAGGAAGETH